MDNNLTELLDNLYVTTWKNMKMTMADNIFDATPFTAYLKMNNRIINETGGRHIEEPIIYSKNDRVKWLKKGGTVDLSDHEFMTETIWDWHYQVVPIVRFGIDEHQNSGKNRLFSLVKAKLENAKTSLEDNLETIMFAGDAAGDEFDGLQVLVADDPTENKSVGDINQGTHDYWRNQTASLSGQSFATRGVDAMRKMLNDCGQNKSSSKPDLIMSSQSAYEYYEDSLLGKYQMENKKMADLGFMNQMFKGTTMMWAPQCTDRMYFLNTKYIRLIKDSRLYFDMTDWKPIPNQVNDRAAQIVSAMAFTTNRRRVNGVIHSIDTP